MSILNQVDVLQLLPSSTEIVRAITVLICVVDMLARRYIHVFYSGEAITSKKPQEIISGIGMLEGNNTAHVQSRD